MHTIQITTHLIGTITGAVILPVQVNGLMRHVYVFKPLAWWEPGTAAAPWYLDSAWWEQILFMAMMTVMPLLIIISLGIVIPKHLAAKEPEEWGYHVLPIIFLTAGIFLPLTKLITLLSTPVLKLSGVEITDDDDNVTGEGIMSMVNEGHERGVLKTGETETITNIFKLGGKETSNIMTRCTNMTALDGIVPFKGAMDSILNEGINTHHPVYREDTDDITGVLHVRDAMVCAEEAEYGDKPSMEIPGFLREADFCPLYTSPSLRDQTTS